VTTGDTHNGVVPQSPTMIGGKVLRIDRNHLAPSFRTIAARSADDQGAATRLAAKIREGGVDRLGARAFAPSRPHGYTSLSPTN